MVNGVERDVFLSLGSNIDPQYHLQWCLACLREQPGFVLKQISTWYRTAPWGGATTAEFLNLALAGRTHLSARALLERTQKIEHQLGRTRTRRYGARTIDIDLLLIGDEVHRDADLQVPHPGLLERDFMLIPLLDIAPPEQRHPITGERLAHARERLRYRQIIAPFVPDEEGCDP